MKTLLSFALFVFTLSTAHSKEQELIELWPENVPGQTAKKEPPVITPNPKADYVKMSKVTNPALVIYKANPKRHNGASVIVCPGGGYGMLAIDKEGYEIAEWLSDLGYTAFVLQYRVPRNKLGALQDAQRAIRCVRGMAEKWKIDTSKIGILGFSAGGSLAARVSTQYSAKLYDPVDTMDRLSARPDFTALIYPAYLDQGQNKSLTPELKLDENTPPMFIFVAADDPYANSSLVMGSALREKKIPFELHILPKGGHGYGMRPGKRAAETWPKLCETWMQLTAQKVIEPKNAK